MNIIYFTSIYYPHEGGIQKVIYYLSGFIQQNGHKPTVITGDTNIERLKVEIINNVSVIRVPIKNNKFGIPMLKDRYDIVTIEQYCKCADIIHNHDIKFLTLFHLFRKKGNTRYFLTSHGFVFHTRKYLFFKYMFMILFSFLSRYYSLIFCSSEHDYEISKKLKLKNCCLLGTGVDVSRFENVSSNKICKNRLFYYGRIAPNKGLENALNKFALLPKDFTFVIAGTGEPVYVQSVIILCNELNIFDRVMFLGGVTEDCLFEQMALAEFVMLPSLYEGFGLTLIESLAARKKIIAHINASYTKILTDLGIKEYLFDFTDSNLSLLEKIYILRGIALTDVDLDRFSFDRINASVLQSYINKS